MYKMLKRSSHLGMQSIFNFHLNKCIQHNKFNDSFYTHLLSFLYSSISLTINNNVLRNHLVSIFFGSKKQ